MTVVEDTVVLIPAWNEEENLPAVLEELADRLPGVEVVVIDDGSTEATADAALEGGATLVSFGLDQRSRAGLAAGYREALQRDFSYCGRVAADDRQSVGELLPLLEAVRSDSCDVAIGFRYTTEVRPPDRGSGPGARLRAGIAPLERVVRSKTDRWTQYRVPGLIAVNAEAMAVLAESSSGGSPEVDAVSRLRGAGLRVREVTLGKRPEADDRPQLPTKKVVLVAALIVSLLLVNRRRRRRRR